MTVRMTKVLCVFFFLPILTQSQTNYYYDINGTLFLVPGTEVTFHDFATRRRYVLDSSHTIISAFDSSAQLIWSTNPRKDNGIEEYRTKNAYLCFMSIDTEDIGFYPKWRCEFFGSIQEAYSSSLDPKMRVLSIGYNNSQFGILKMDN